MGARRARIFATVLLEGMVTGLIAAAIGVLLGHFSLWLATRSLASLSEAGIVPWQIGTSKIAIVAASVDLGALAKAIPAFTVTSRCLATGPHTRGGVSWRVLEATRENS